MNEPDDSLSERELKAYLLGRADANTSALKVISSMAKSLDTQAREHGDKALRHMIGVATDTLEQLATAITRVEEHIREGVKKDSPF